ncbi:glycine zipper 2TM domain-containing protein [Phenylobacterium sp.]|jgi:uncharacterized protein YcfJ|uniref:glycine zipper 2TM domain-containing protein n=1 Tax=Phenylobacterium sp. TaxID=1871053 RepID=UPI002F40380F
MTKVLTTLGLCATLVGATAIPDLASARTHHPRQYHRTYKSCRGSANTGTLVGAVGGGLLGNAVTHGGTGGTLIGAGAGAVAGHQIAKSNCRRR